MRFLDFMCSSIHRSTAVPIRLRKPMQRKSGFTYLSTLDKVISEYSDITVYDILTEKTMVHFIQEQNRLYDQTHASKRRKTNSYQPAWSKFFEWLKAEAPSGCQCDTCVQVNDLFANPQKQGEFQQPTCLNCGCGEHFTALSNSCCKHCHEVNMKTGNFCCFGRFECVSCLRNFPFCKFSKVTEFAQNNPAVADMVLQTLDLICDLCYPTKSTFTEWKSRNKTIHKVALIRKNQGEKKLETKHQKDIRLKATMRKARCPLPSAERDDLLTYRQTSRLMQERSANVGGVVEFLERVGAEQRQGFDTALEVIENKLKVGARLSQTERDIVAAVTNYHLEKKDGVVVSPDGASVVFHKKRKLTETV